MERHARETIVCRNPATGEVIDEIAVVSAEQARQAVERARAAFADWSARSFSERAEVLLSARDLLLDRVDEIVTRLCRETGKARGDVFADLISPCDLIGYYAANGERILRERTLQVHLARNKRTRVAYEARGVVLNISPWNYPLDLALSPAIAALFAGNVVIIKPSEVTPLIAQYAASIFHEAGVPADALQVLPGYGETAAALIEHVDQVAFTGSVATGRKVARACAERLIPCTLELGGKDPAIVLEDADLERAAQGIVWGAFFNCGQTCMSVERVYVVDAVADRFIDKVVEKTRALRQGVESSKKQLVDVGSMTSPPQVDIVDDHVEDARAQGAQVLTGGERPQGDGAWYPPTVLTDVTHEMKIMRDETFGPVLPIMRVADEDEAVRLANDSPYGLSSSVWTGDRARGVALARRLKVGSVNVNEVLAHYAVAEAPFGGVKHSGVGRRHGDEELLKYCEQKTILEDLIGLKSEPYWYPHTRSSVSGMLKAIRVLFGRGVKRKLKGLLR